MAEEYRYEARDEKRNASIVLISATPLSEVQVTRAAVFLARAGMAKSGRAATFDLRMWSADELRILEMQGP